MVDGLTHRVMQLEGATDAVQALQRERLDLIGNGHRLTINSGLQNHSQLMHMLRYRDENCLPYNTIEILLRHSAVLPGPIATYLTLIWSLLRWHCHSHASIGIAISGRSGD